MALESLAKNTGQERFFFGSAVDGSAGAKFEALVVGESVFCNDVAMLVDCILWCNVDWS